MPAHFSRRSIKARLAASCSFDGWVTVQTARCREIVVNRAPLAASRRISEIRRLKLPAPTVRIEPPIQGGVLH